MSEAGDEPPAAARPRVTRGSTAGPDVEVLVVGAGLAGLTVARDVAAHGIGALVVDARRRVGGRTMTVTPDGDAGGWFDLGATWLWSDQPEIQRLAADLGMASFAEPLAGRALREGAGESPPVPVELPAPPAAFLRFTGGTEQVCSRLAAHLPEGSLALGEKVTGVAHDGDHLAVATEAAGEPPVVRTAARVVIALPPRLVIQDITFEPGLPEELQRVMEATPTWMGDAMKCVAIYEAPFWRQAGLSGSAFSEVGPLEEVHDASVPGGPAALWGFVALDPDFRDMGPAERVPLVLAQLGRLFGPEAADPVQYFERDWSADPYTCEAVHRHVDPVPYGDRSFSVPLWEGRLSWAGTETVSAGGGHMEGAVRSGHRAAREILASLR